MSPQGAARFLIGLVVLCLVLWCVWMLLGMFPLPHPIPTIIMVILLLIALGALLNWVGWWGTPGRPL